MPRERAPLSTRHARTDQRPASTEADRADIYALYEQSVQSPAIEAKMIAGVFMRRRNRRATILREDFCGSAALSAAWLGTAGDRTAIAVDLDPTTLAYAYLHRALPLGRDAARLELRNADVRDRSRDQADVVCAYNFSYSTFKRRRELADYFAATHATLARDGMFFLDVFGGVTAQQTSLELRDCGTFDYVWEQERYNPLTNELLAHIHFRFADGSMKRNAFTYDWRLWTVIELRELLEDAGFTSSDVYWEDRAKDGERLDRFRVRKNVDNEPAWNAYVIALR